MADGTSPGDAPGPAPSPAVPSSGAPGNAAPAAASLGVGALAPFVLFGTGKLIERELNLRLADLGLSLRTLGVLGHLAHSPGASYSELARRADVTAQTMHATVRRLIADDVVQTTDTVAGQSAELSITRHGSIQLGKARDAIEAYETELAERSGLTVDELRATARAAMTGAWTIGARPPEFD